jgi:two-component system response regulator CiaR
VVVLDMMMPVLDGYGVLEAKREHADTTPVIVVSARSDPRDCRRALELGAVEYVIKPFDIDRLLRLASTVAAESESARTERREAALRAQGA